MSIFFGPVTAATTRADADVEITGESEEDEFGSDIAQESIDASGDVNGDGYIDLLVGAPYEDSGGSSAGKVYLWLGPVTSGSRSAATYDAAIAGTEAYANIGYNFATTDLDGDGSADLLLGALNDNTSAIDAGAVFVYYGPISGDTDASSADAAILGEAEDDDLGFPMTGGFDWNGDSYEDILVASPDYVATTDDEGIVYMVFGGSL